jgi:hydrogenase maturation protein HypF
MLAVGGELKATIGLARDQTAWLSQHIGDTTNLETMRMLERTVATMCEVQRVDPEVIISDLHPGYLSRAWAQDWAAQHGLEFQGVQHHHAHAASLLVEHQRSEPIVAFTFDGTGYGSDGQLWGGEVLIAGLSAAERIGHLEPRMLPGGDSATRHVHRVALSYLYSAGEPWQEQLPPVGHASGQELTILGRMLETGTGCTPTTSVGRLFDAVSALLGIRQSVDYEGQAAIELEAWASQSQSAGSWRADVRDDLTIDPSPMIRAAVRAALAGTPRADAARAFHLGLAQTVADVANRVRERWAITTVGLTGGVFSNAVLTRACQETLGSAGFAVLTHRRVPANDGGLALGQLAVVAAQREGEE